MTKIELRPDRFKIHASEKVSTGEYESADYHATIEGEVATADALENGTREELKARLLAAQRDLQEVVERSAENRISEEGDWSVPKREGSE